MATVVYGDFEWDDDKAAQNLLVHGVSFEEASTAFEDVYHRVTGDGSGRPGHFLLIGFSSVGQLLTVVHVERGVRDRIVSAWQATRREREIYRGYEP